MWKWVKQLWLVALLATGCELPAFGGFSDSPPTPAPPDDILTYTVPVYSKSLQPGDKIPGAALQYVQPLGEGYETLIGGQRAVKRAGDSFAWRGIVAPGVAGNYNLRLTTVILGGLVAGGQIQFSILNPQPAYVTDISLQTANAELHFANLPLQYLVPLEGMIPGSSLRYDQMISGDNNVGGGQTMAKLSGNDGYPYYAVGDSIIWNGQLRPNVFVRHNFRIVDIDERWIRVAGISELWIDE